MPLKKINYDNIHFYKIVCKDLTISDCYIGHTSDFASRKSNHKKSCNDDTRHNHNQYVYQVIRENGGWENWDMILIETKTCENGLETRKIEREHIENSNATLNIHQKPYASPEERQERKKEWIGEHKVQVRQSQKESEKRLKEQHPERYKQYASTRWERHKHKYLAKIECECGSTFSHMHRCKHIKLKKHQQYLQSLNQNNPQE